MSGLEEGKVGGSRDTIGLLVVCKQPLQSLHVEPVITIHSVFGGLEGLGHRDGAAHCREGRCGRQGSLAANETDSSSPPQGSPLTHSSDGQGKWYQTPEVAEKRLRPQKMQGENPVSLLKAIWHRRCQEFWSTDLIL